MTAQVHEQLILDGRRTLMAFCPPLPEGHPRLTTVTPESMTYSDTDAMNSSACWRGYVGTCLVVAKRAIENHGQQWNGWDLAVRNFPGGENRFDGDDHWD